jgi:hypothetical protein
VRAYDGFATSLEVVVLGVLHGVDASFDTSTDGFDGVAHSKSVRCWCWCVKGSRRRWPSAGIMERTCGRGKMAGGACGLTGTPRTQAGRFPRQSTFFPLDELTP